jgi:hypothetical protein
MRHLDVAVVDEANGQRVVAVDALDLAAVPSVVE